MFILTIIGLLITAVAVYLFVGWFNDYSYRKGEYRFFSIEHTFAYVASYFPIFLGCSMIKSDWEHDPLNGIIIMVLGIIILIFTVINNFKNTNRSLAIKGTIAQLIFYIPICVITVSMFYVALSFFSETKPVYNINNKD
ncbi:hypothetical protein [Sulfuricurvum sp.]|uniref:hypothetical protein n=1 Tax=Sulfuricurvum sp. TaxID=2025608 RepID=UPI002D3FCE6E|nr:hypothetical protein [Sulfuricurvum sp.]HZF69396.1 hypothetical protein [Sulfuricurvum sp.]